MAFESSIKEALNKNNTNVKSLKTKRQKHFATCEVQMKINSLKWL